MSRLTACTVFSGLVTDCRLAIWPTSRSPPSAKPTTDGVVRDPSALAMTTTLFPSITATQELVVPRSIPMTRLIQEGSSGRLRVVPVGARPAFLAVGAVAAALLAAHFLG